MQMCQSHWNRLRATIESSGMGNLGAKNGEEAVERLKQEIDGVATDETFDPLMSAHNMIFSAALRAGGLYILGDCCPLCEVDKHGASSEEWIKGCVEEILRYCVEKGLISSN